MKRKKILLIIAAIMLLLCIWAGWMLLTEKDLTVVQYEVPAELMESIRIVQLTDLHSWEFGEENRKLVQLVAEQKPDLILMTGDSMLVQWCNKN